MGWLTPTQTTTAATLSLLLAFTIGLNLRKLSEQLISYDPYMHFVTITSVFNAFAYTGGPYPHGCIGLGNVSLAYSGLGDLFAFFNFGVVATVTPSPLPPYLPRGYTTFCRDGVGTWVDVPIGLIGCHSHWILRNGNYCGE